MRKDIKNSRRDFLKKMPVAVGSVVAISSLSFIFRKSRNISQHKVNSLSKNDADELIKKNKSLKSAKIKPSPAPISDKIIKG